MICVDPLFMFAVEMLSQPSAYLSKEFKEVDPEACMSKKDFVKMSNIAAHTLKRKQEYLDGLLVS